MVNADRLGDCISREPPAAVYLRALNVREIRDRVTQSHEDERAAFAGVNQNIMIFVLYA
jgi:hypothetical protein